MEAREHRGRRPALIIASTSARNGGRRGTVIRVSGPLLSYDYSPAAATIDGLSNTAILGEKLRGRVSGTRFNPRTDFVEGGEGLPYTIEEMYSSCATIDGNLGGFQTASGLSWFIGGLPQSAYNHVIEPNSTLPDCLVGTQASAGSGLFGARSNHPGGVQIAMADGSVRFVRNSIRREVWMAIGTRAGVRWFPTATSESSRSNGQSNSEA